MNDNKKEHDSMLCEWEDCPECEPVPSVKSLITLKLTQKEYSGLIQFLRQRSGDIEDDQEDLGLLLPLLVAFNTRILWTEVEPEK